MFIEGNHIVFPMLQIWRPDTSDPFTYRKVQEFPLLTASGEAWTEVLENVYEHVFPESGQFAVQQGDILGMYLSRQTGNRQHLDVFFELSGGSVVEYYIHNELQTEIRISDVMMSRGRPLVAFEVLCDGMQGIVIIILL